MKKILVAAVAAITMVFGGGDVAPVENVSEGAFTGGLYIGGGFTAPQTYVDGEKSIFEDDTFNEYGLGLGAQIGYVAYNTGDFSVAVEGRVARSFWEFGDDYTYNYGVYVKPEVYLVDGTVGIYALAGYANVGIGSDIAIIETNKSGFAYGAGIEYFVTGDISVYGDYVMLPTFDTDLSGVDVNNDQFQIGLNYRF